MFNLLKKNVLFFISLFLVLIVFLFYLQYPFRAQKENLDSSEYKKIIKKINKKNSKNLIEAEHFIIKNQNIYGTLTALYLAKKYTLEGTLNKAFLQLNNSLKYTKEENLKNILKLRMAKIKMQNSENKDALNILENIKNHNWDNIIENMKGDIFINEKNKKEAIKAWRKSLSIENSNASKEIINIKIAELNE
ncbi:tetratricopeptide repeat protein [Buchnera aphidicola (Hyperomyzus lactucae)]|uniref:Ancillary SecYEG translocon subunit n=1 Tax=Buchnera aphidicola (Hyperomyzus lactucae) TaxID=1241860 RepID=A0A4D6Y4G6_9GAMM|nr:tetratricopeptide repeat protein [Buchnera aphidicola]QCI21304.1 tetratricopeptide repeat protein [Buchnera aphidicola (Hyperomyzus lactucae)]